MIIKVNLGGKYEDVVITKEEEIAIKEKTLKDNIDICIKINDLVGNKLSEEIKAVLCQQATQHFVFRCDNFAKLQFLKKLEEQE